jgi:hypothetical protein
MSSPDVDDLKAEPGYEPDTDEVQSLDSEVLHEYRPNRWKGDRERWQRLTEAERQDHRAINSIRDQDLSAHLYNAFAMKKRSNAAASAPIRTRSVCLDSRGGVRVGPLLTEQAESKRRRLSAT